MAANLALYISEAEKPFLTSDLAKFYSLSQAYKDTITRSGGLRPFCDKHAGLLAYQWDVTGDEIVLPKHCCYFLRGTCTKKHSHGNFLHDAAVVGGDACCSYGPLCKRGHWQLIEALAGGSSISKEAEDADAEDDLEQEPDVFDLSVDQIRWAHDSIEIHFKNGCLLIDTLEELLSASLQPSALPKLSVWQKGDVWYAITGNRRLWVLKELSRILGRDVRVPVRRLSEGAAASAWFRRMFTTRTGGESVCFVASKHHYPSMSFAMASLNPSTAPDAHDLEIGHVLQSSSGGVRLTSLDAKFQPRFSAAGRVRARPDLFCIEASTVVVFASAVRASASGDGHRHGNAQQIDSGMGDETGRASGQGRTDVPPTHKAAKTSELKWKLKPTSSPAAEHCSSNLPAGKSGKRTDMDDAQQTVATGSKEAQVEAGKFVSVRKHSSIGCAVVSFQDVGVRQHILAKASCQQLGNVSVEIAAHVDPATSSEVPTDLFVAWGRKVEQSTPLSIHELVSYFDDKHQEVQRERACQATTSSQKSEEEAWREAEKRSGKQDLVQARQVHDCVLQFRPCRCLRILLLWVVCLCWLPVMSCYKLASPCRTRRRS